MSQPKVQDTKSGAAAAAATNSKSPGEGRKSGGSFCAAFNFVVFSSINSLLVHTQALPLPARPLVQVAVPLHPPRRLQHQI